MKRESIPCAPYLLASVFRTLRAPRMSCVQLTGAVTAARAGRFRSDCGRQCGGRGVRTVLRRLAGPEVSSAVVGATGAIGEHTSAYLPV